MKVTQFYNKNQFVITGKSIFDICENYAYQNQTTQASRLGHSFVIDEQIVLANKKAKKY